MTRRVPVYVSPADPDELRAQAAFTAAAELGFSREGLGISWRPAFVYEAKQVHPGQQWHATHRKPPSPNISPSRRRRR